MTSQATPDLDSKPFADPLSLFDVSGKSALVTGASGAFGSGVARALGSLGVNLTLAAGNGEAVAELSEKIEADGGTAQHLELRPETLEQAEAMVDAAVSAYGRLDQLVVASGFNQPGFIEQMPPEEWQGVMDANVRGAWLVAKAFGQWALENGAGGKVLFMSSVRGRHGNYSGYTAYCSSKGAIDSLTRCLGAEWGKHGITVNAIAPTVFRSSLTAWMFGDDELGQQTRERSLSRIPMKRLGEVEDLIGMALYLLSPASDFCTGQVMYVDGGYTAA
jgi:NAD(P)-dependent dehydrogenase (short-subunit alcohol dehydrogenase family)